MASTRKLAATPRHEYQVDSPRALYLGGLHLDPAALNRIVGEYERHTAGSVAQGAKTAHCLRQLVELSQYGALSLADAVAYMSMVDETAAIGDNFADLYHAAARAQVMLLADQLLAAVRVGGRNIGELMALWPLPPPVVRRRGILYRMIFGDEEGHR